MLCGPRSRLDLYPHQHPHRHPHIKKSPHSRQFSNVWKAWVTLGLFGSFGSFAGLCGPVFGNCGASCPRGPGRLEPACNFEQFERLERQLEFRAGSHQFRATHRYFEQAACISSKVNHGLIRGPTQVSSNPLEFRATRLHFEQPARISSNQPISSVSSA